MRYFDDEPQVTEPTTETPVEETTEMPAEGNSEEGSEAAAE